jgi:hypothetical protein
MEEKKPKDKQDSNPIDPIATIWCFCVAFLITTFVLAHFLMTYLASSQTASNPDHTNEENRY